MYTPSKKLGFANAEGDNIVDDQELNDTINGTTANQAYKDAVNKGSFTGTFAQFVDKYGNKGLLNSALDTIGKIGSLFKASTPAPASSPSPNPAPAPGNMPPAPTGTTILGMSLPVAIIVGTIVIGGISYGIYRMVKK